MIRRVTHTLKFATNTKKQKLDLLFEEYSRVVNEFIKLYWNNSILPKKANTEVYNQVPSWLMGKARKCAVAQAMKILRSVRKKDRDKIYKVYQRIYVKALKLGKNKFSILASKWSEWNKGKRLRHRIRMPVFNGNTVELNSDLVYIQDPKKAKHFDMWIRLGSIWGDKFSLFLPSKHFEISRKYQNQEWDLAGSAVLRKRIDGTYFIDLFWEKPNLAIKPKVAAIGVDIGINKLLTLSIGDKLGSGIKQKIQKLNRRQQNSKNWNQTRTEIKDYIGFVTNQFPWDQSDTVVMEQIKGITQNTKGKINKTTRKLLGHWNINLLYRRMAEKAEENRVHLAFVDPAYTSQQCSSCGKIHKKSRTGEKFKCVSCGSILDADHNASLNILQRYLNREVTVPYNTKTLN